MHYAGDIHGRTNDTSALIQRAEAMGISTLVQVGDFGVFGPRNCTLYKMIAKRARQNKWKTKIITCFGNHDNWDLYYELCMLYPDEDLLEIVPGSGVFVARRGSVIEIEGIKHLFMGGACSNDRHHRTEGVDWWDREEPDIEEFNDFFQAWETHKPDTILTHEAPLRVPIKRALRKSNTTVRMLDNAIKLSSHKPKRWYFGHHHRLEKWKIDGIKFYCCGLHGDYWERSLRGSNE